MLIVFNIPDKYVHEWYDLQNLVGAKDFEQFCIHAMGIGVKTIQQAVGFIHPDVDNVVSFDPDYFKKKKLQCNLKLEKENGFGSARDINGYFGLKNLTHY